MQTQASFLYFSLKNYEVDPNPDPPDPDFNRIRIRILGKIRIRIRIQRIRPSLLLSCFQTLGFGPHGQFLVQRSLASDPALQDTRLYTGQNCSVQVYVCRTVLLGGQIETLVAKRF